MNYFGSSDRNTNMFFTKMEYWFCKWDVIKFEFVELNGEKDEGIWIWMV